VQNGGCPQSVVRRAGVGQLTRISHQLSAAAADPGMAAASRSVGFLDVLSSTPAGILPSRALYPCPSAPPRDETW